MIEPWELAVREAVRETLARYNHAGDRGRVGELAEQFTPDGILEIHDGARMEGRASIAEGLGGAVRRSIQSAAPGGPPIVRHHVSSVLIHAVTPERAEAASYFAVLTRDGLDHWGRYRDVLVPYDGRWLLAHRLVRVDAQRSGSPLAEGL
jgi:SnoaL-like domain